MKWYHILEHQPENGSIVIQMDAPYESYKGDFKNHYTMGMRQYNDNGCPWDTYIQWCEERNNKPNFWWTYAKDFPFPDKHE